MLNNCECWKKWEADFGYGTGLALVRPVLPPVYPLPMECLGIPPPAAGERYDMLSRNRGYIFAKWKPSHSFGSA